MVAEQLHPMHARCNTLIQEIDVRLHSGTFNPCCSCRLLSYVGKYGSSHRALAVFNWLDGQSNYETRDCFIYTRLMSLFGRGSANARVALELFDRMQAANVKPDLIAFNAAISAAGAFLPSATVAYDVHLCIGAKYLSQS